MEAILLFFWEENYSDKLTFCCDEVSLDNTDWNAIVFSVFLEFSHGLFIAYLNYSRSFENKRVLIDFSRIFCDFAESISFFNNWNRLSSQGTLIDQSTSL